MRIFSKNHDYYDGVRAWGVDPMTTYKRDVNYFDASSQEYKDIFEIRPIKDRLSRLPHVDFHNYGIGVKRSLVIVFCGKIYPLVVCRYGEGITHGKEKVKYCYTLNSLTSFILRYETKEFIKSYNKGSSRRWMGRVTKNNLKQLFADSGKMYEELMEYHHISGVPVFFVEPQADYKQHLAYNPVLKDLKFYKIFDSYQTFQELSMFISGVMGGQAPPMVQISDEIRLEKHGFDKKLSFRKEKE